MNWLPPLPWHPVALICGAALLAPVARAGEPTPPQTSPVAAVCRSVTGALLGKPDPMAGWTTFKAGDRLRPGVTLVALPKAEIDSLNGKVRLEMLADIAQRGPFPVLESAVVLHSAPGADLALTHDRGLISLVSLGNEPATVQLRVLEETWEVTLQEAGTRVLLELYGRHAPGGEMFANSPGEPVAIAEHPTVELAALVVKGKLSLKIGSNIYGLRAPPGSAALFWDNLTGVHGVNYLPAVPDNVHPATPSELAKIRELVGAAAGFNSKGVQEALAGLLASDDPRFRRRAVNAARGVDDLPGLVKALVHPKDAEVRDAAVLALRHWMGRKPGQAAKVFAALEADKRFDPVTARMVLQLLDGFSDEDRNRADTYELLVLFLEHDQLPVRQLAWWHLHRLAEPADRVRYDAASPQPERQRAVAELRRVLPRGQVPARPKTDPDKLPTNRQGG